MTSFGKYCVSTLAALTVSVSTAAAATLAAGAASGTYDISTPVEPGPSTVVIDGTFFGEFFPAAIPTTQSFFTFGAGAVIDGLPPLSGEVEVVGGPDDLDALVALGLFGVDLLIDNEAMPIPLPGGVGSFMYDFTDVIATPTTITGDFVLTATTLAPVGPLVDAALVDILTLLDLPPGLLGGFTFPNNASGTFAVLGTIDVRATPVPAGAVLLVTGLAVIGVARRRRAA